MCINYVGSMQKAESMMSSSLLWYHWRLEVAIGPILGVIRALSELYGTSDLGASDQNGPFQSKVQAINSYLAAFGPNRSNLEMSCNFNCPEKARKVPIATSTELGWLHQCESHYVCLWIWLLLTHCFALYIGLFLCMPEFYFKNVRNESKIRNAKPIDVHSKSDYEINTFTAHLNGIKINNWIIRTQSMVLMRKWCE